MDNGEGIKREGKEGVQVWEREEKMSRAEPERN